MRERARGGAKGARRGPFSVDVVLLTPHGDQLAMLVQRSQDPRARERWVLPWESPRGEEGLATTAGRLARAVSGVDPAWMEQVGAFGDGKRHPSEATLSVAFVGVVAQGTADRLGEDDERSWVAVRELPQLAPRQRTMADAALESVRSRLDYAPIAFRLLPAEFTLSDLQQMYEILLGRRLHKASFRRALQAAFLVEPIDEWRSEGRGRPAQLFRYAPRRRRSGRRGVRFELLG